MSTMKPSCDCWTLKTHWIERSSVSDEYFVQVAGVDIEPEEERPELINDEALFRLLDPEDALDREIYGSEYEAQCLGIDTEVDEITAAFFEAAGEEPSFREPGSSEDNEVAESRPQESMCALVHAAGFGILDTGCGRGLVGAKTLERHVDKLRTHGYDITELPEKMHTFRYGNGSADRTGRRVEMPVFVGGKELRVRLHVVPGDVPLLISKRLLKSLGAMIDLNANKLIMTKAGVAADIHEMKDNSYQINLLDLEPGEKLCSPEVDVTLVAVHQEESSQDDESEDTGVRCVFKAKDRKHWDWTIGEHRRRAEQVLHLVDPDFTIFSPPCGPLSLMQNLTKDSKRCDLSQHQIEVHQAKGMVRWSLKQSAERIRSGNFFV